MKEKYKVSEYLHFLQVDEEIYVGWNRFFPSIFILNKSALELLERIKKNNLPPADEAKNIDLFLQEFKKYKFIYAGDSDPSKKDYLAIVQQRLAELERKATDFYQKKKDYADLKIVNDVCNLRCTYCVNEESQPGRPPHTRVKKGLATEDRLRIIDGCVDVALGAPCVNHDIESMLQGGAIRIDKQRDMVCI